MLRFFRKQFVRHPEDINPPLSACQCITVHLSRHAKFEHTIGLGIDSKQSVERVIKRTSILITLTLSGWWFLLVVIAVSAPVQDIIPLWGMIILLLLFPFVMINSLMGWKASG